MSFIENIKKRSSIRSFNGEKLNTEQEKYIHGAISSATVLFNSKVRIELINNGERNATERLGTYGVISGARNFLVAVCQTSSTAEYDLGYALEQVVLKCTELGLGTCWLGGTFRKSNFASAVGLKEGEQLPIVVPIGTPAQRKTFIDKAMGFMVSHTSRRKFETLFFDGGWERPLDEKNAGRYLVPLQMVRLAPSASNGQPWRVVLDEGMIHFYRNVRKSAFTKIDLGIALCHFYLACKETGIDGVFENVSVEIGGKPTELEYVTTWCKR